MSDYDVMVVSLTIVVISLTVYSIFTPNDEQFNFLWDVLWLMAVCLSVMLVIKDNIYIRLIGICLIIMNVIYILKANKIIKGIKNKER